MNKKILAILMVLICALSISAVSAADDSSADDAIAVGEAGSFTELKSLIDGATNTVNLDKNYTYSTSTDSSISTITINKGLTIDGKGHTIDASGKSSIFTIAKGTSVTIKNITFVNGNSINGGAITNNGTLNVYDDCDFINNSASNMGGAITNVGTLNVYGACDLIDNSAVNGGVIYNDGTLNVNKECKFIDNSAVNGGVIYNKGSLNVRSVCDFIDNSADVGGVFDNKGSLNVYGTCKFINNSADVGGVVSSNGMTFNVYGVCDFIDNSADVGGVFDNKGSLNVYGTCKFINNSADNGGAINNNGTFTVQTNGVCEFIDNSAAVDGGAINNDKSLNLYGVCKFINNSAVDGGAINNNNYLDIRKSEFSDNSAVDGGAINNNGTLEICFFSPGKCEFSNNSAANDGGAINNNGELYACYMGGELSINNNTASNAGGAINNNGELSIGSASINNNTAPIGADIAAGINSTGTDVPSDIAVTFITSITINPIDAVVVGENVTITGNVSSIPDGANVTVTVNNGDKYNVTVVNATFSCNIGNFTTDGNKTIAVEYAGNENYASCTDSINVTVVKKATGINITDFTGIAGDKIIINGTVSAIPENATIVITVAGKNYTSKVNNTKFSAVVENLTAGNYNITVNYAGDNEYASANAAANLTVNQVATSIAIDDLNIFIGEDAVIVGNVTGIPENSTLIIAVAGKEYNTIVNGTKFLVTVENLTLGSYNITVAYEGTIKYESANATATVNVSKYPTVINITDVLEADERLLINATLTSEDKPVNGTVELLINGKSIVKEEAADGKVSFNVTAYAGELNVMLKFAGDDKYDGSNATYDISVNGTEASLTVPDVTLFFKNGTNLLVYLAANGTNVSNETVTININGVDYTRTIKNGTAKIAINLAPGTYNAVVSLFSQKYNFASANATVTVLPVIEGNDTVLFFKNGTRYVALFLDGQGKPLENASVQFNINGRLYNRTTNVNGTAGLAINLAPGEYIITATNLGNGAVHSNNITVLPVIEGNDTVLFFKNGTRYVALFLDGQGKPLENASVQFNINGVLYNRTTDANGTAGLAINLAPGEYIITAVNLGNGAVHSNNITVLPTIISENIVKYYKNETQYVVKVVDGQGNGLANQTVEYNINGVFYKRTTDANGTAVFNINLAAGNSEPEDYIITASCNNCTVSNNVTVLPVLTAEDFNEYMPGKKFTAKIVDGQGKPLKGANIQFNINGVVYNRTSDVNGTVGLTINLNEGHYIISTVCTDNGAVISNNVWLSHLEIATGYPYV